MSQKKLKKLRRLENVDLIKKNIFEPVLGIRQIIKENWKFLLLLTIGIFLLYFNSLRGDFVSDDYASITQNPSITDLGYMMRGLLPSLSNWSVASIFGISSSVPYHVLSLLMYLIVAVEVFVFIYLLFNKNVAILTALLFSVLPTHVEAISWISGKPYLISAVFILLGLIFLFLFLKTTNKKYFWYLIFLLPFVFMADRVRSIAFILLSTPIFLVYKNNFKIKIKWDKIFFFFFVGTVIVTIFVWPLIIQRIGSVNSGYNGSGGIFYDPRFQYPTAIAKYLQLIFIPTDLTLYHTMYIIPDWLNWAILLVFIGNIIYFWFKNKNIFFALAFIFLATAPSMAPVKVSWLVAERYVFLGSLGFCLFLALCFEKLEKKNKYISLILFIVLIGFYSVRTFLRNIDWQTNHNLWVNTCQVSPNSHNAWNNIGDDYDKLKQYDNAVKGFTQSTVVKPDYADAFHNRANIFYKTGRLDLARDSYETALKYSPGLFQTYFSLIQIDLTEKRYDLAMDHLNKLNTIKPNDVQVYYITAIVYTNMGQQDKAIPILEQIVKAVPQFTQAKQLLDQILNVKK